MSQRLEWQGNQWSYRRDIQQDAQGKVTFILYQSSCNVSQNSQATSLDSLCAGLRISFRYGLVGFYFMLLICGCKAEFSMYDSFYSNFQLFDHHKYAYFGYNLYYWNSMLICFHILCPYAYCGILFQFHVSSISFQTACPQIGTSLRLDL